MADLHEAMLTEIDFAHAQFVYSHAEIKVPMPKSPNTSKFAGISSL